MFSITVCLWIFSSSALAEKNETTIGEMVGSSNQLYNSFLIVIFSCVGIVVFIIVLICCRSLFLACFENFGLHPPRYVTFSSVYCHESYSKTETTYTGNQRNPDCSDW